MSRAPVATLVVVMAAAVGVLVFAFSERSRALARTCNFQNEMRSAVRDALEVFEGVAAQDTSRSGAQRLRLADAFTVAGARLHPIAC